MPKVRSCLMAILAMLAFSLPSLALADITFNPNAPNCTNVFDPPPKPYLPTGFTYLSITASDSVAKIASLNLTATFNGSDFTSSLPTTPTYTCLPSSPSPCPPLATPPYSYTSQNNLYTWSSTLNLGTYNFTARAVNGVGNTSICSGQYDISNAITPWIQTTGGDVHSNTGINTPGGP